jgi:hypothetical protein
MGKLKPIGSEKLEGLEKIQRIMEIARYKENLHNSINDSNSNHYNIKLVDGNTYHIEKEKNGYVIKRTLSEGQLEYIEPMKNRKYYQSYSQAFMEMIVTFHYLMNKKSLSLKPLNPKHQFLLNLLQHLPL